MSNKTRVNIRQRERRASRRSAVRRQDIKLELELSVPCCFGEHHAIRVSIANDGTLRSVQSECTVDPPTEAEYTVAKALHREADFFTCRSFVFQILQAAGRRVVMYDPGYLRRVVMYDPGYLRLDDGQTNSWEFERWLSQRDVSPMFLLEVLRLLRIKTHTKRKARESRKTEEYTECFDHALDMLVRSKHGTRRNLGHNFGLNISIVLEGPPGLRRALAVWGKNATASGVNVMRIATYLGHGRFRVDEDRIRNLARQSPSPTNRKKACAVCGKKFTSIDQHVNSERHFVNTRTAVLDILTSISENFTRTIAEQQEIPPCTNSTRS